MPGRPAWEPHQLERNRFVRFRTGYMFERFVDLSRDRDLKIFLILLWRRTRSGCVAGDVSERPFCRCRH